MFDSQDAKPLPWTEEILQHQSSGVFTFILFFLFSSVVETPIMCTEVLAKLTLASFTYVTDKINN